MHCIFRGNRMVASFNSYRAAARFMSRRHGCYYRFVE